VVVAALANARQLAGVLAEDEGKCPLVDIGANTFVAGHWFMDGENPYAQRAQLVHRVEHAPGVTRSPAGQLLMWGVPYDYGYPYFPVMFLFYLPFLALPMGLREDRRGAIRLVSSYVAVTVGLILPFALLDPARFVSSTILFYLSMHGEGDSTSLWYFLPQGLRAPFLVAGWLFTLATVGLPRLRGGTLGSALTAAFASYTLLIAFSPMSHLNYLVAVLSLGAVALAVGAVERRRDFAANERR
jgi:hypothetical protein